MIKVLRSIFFKLPILKFKAEGPSMDPLIKNGQTVLVNKLSYIFKNPKIGDIIILKNPDKKSKDKKYIIKKISEIDQEKYFVIGINLKESTDSRTFGLVGKKEIIGKVLS